MHLDSAFFIMKMLKGALQMIMLLKVQMQNILP